MRWVEIAVEAVDASVDAVANILIDEGCGGAVIGPTPSSTTHNATRVAGYLPVDDRLEERLARIRERVLLLPSYGLPLESEEITIAWVQDEEWATAWKKHFKPVRVGKVVVKPTWEDFAALEGDIIVEIDPAMAFGTGYHPTTQLCLLALQDRIKGGESVLDVGTGSGILAIAAARLGARSVVGLDFDSVAVEAATANVEQAGLAGSVAIRQADSPRAFEGQADLVVANIIAKVLVDIAGELSEKVRPGGTVIGSGIVTERVDDVRKAFEAEGLRVVEERVDGDWVALIAERVEDLQVGYLEASYLEA